MITVNFYLDKKPNRKLHSVFLYFRYNGKLLKYNSKLRIEENYWSTTQKKVKSTDKFPPHPEYNYALTKLGHTATKEYWNYKNLNGIDPSPKQLRALIDKALGRKTSGNSTFLDFVETYLKEAETQKSDGTIRSLKSTLKNLRNFSKAKNYPFDFNDINSEFYQKFVSYLSNDVNLKQNTIGNNIKNLKSFLNNATDRGLNKSMAFKQFKVYRKPVDDAIYLTTSELKKLYKMNLEDNQRLYRVRDLFLIGCYTGLRFSDFSRLKAENFVTYRGEKIISVVTKKTRTKVEIPIHKNIKAILKRNGGEIPQFISVQKMNKYLKELCELAGFDESVEITTTNKGNLSKSYKKKFELVTTHTARRSFATNAYLSGMPTYQIMLITGHKKESTFLQYIRITKRESASQLNNHAFFSE